MKVALTLLLSMVVLVLPAYSANKTYDEKKQERLDKNRKERRANEAATDCKAGRKEKCK